MPTRYQLRKSKKRRKAFEELLLRLAGIAAPKVLPDGCEECGGKWRDASPPEVEHYDDCQGVMRQNEVELCMLAYKRDIL